MRGVVVRLRSPRVVALVMVLAAATALAGDQVSNSSAVISVDELREGQLRGAEILLLDARDRKSYDLLHIEDAQLPLADEMYDQLELFQKKVIGNSPDTDAALAERMRAYPKEIPVVTYCNENCGASHHLQNQLLQLGFTDVRVLKPGIQEWERKGYPVVRSATSAKGGSASGGKTSSDQKITA